MRRRRPDRFAAIGLAVRGDGVRARPDGARPGLRARIGLAYTTTRHERSDAPRSRDRATEIWLYGLRNPWRFSFDRANGDLYVADVGQSAWEEVNVLPAGSPGGVNYGWNIMEGNHCYAVLTCTRSGLTLPVVEYATSEGCAVSGGYAYRGTRVPALVGVYLYGDFCGGWVRSLRHVGGQATELYDWPSLRVSGGLSSFGEDARGELYIATLSGGLYRIVDR